MVPMPPANWLFVQTGQPFASDGKTLRIRGVAPQTLIFSDRPERMTGDVLTPKFIEFWNQGKDDFQKDPPNATISTVIDGKTDLVVVELLNPRREADELVYDIKLLSGTMPAAGEQISLFIDWWYGPGWRRGWGWGLAFRSASTRRRPRRRGPAGAAGADPTVTCTAARGGAIENGARELRPLRLPAPSGLSASSRLAQSMQDVLVPGAVACPSSTRPSTVYPPHLALFATWPGLSRAATGSRHGRWALAPRRRLAPAVPEHWCGRAAGRWGCSHTARERHG